MKSDDVDARTQTEANAHLIAAAPELLRVCKAIATDASAYPWHQALRAVIAKAEGR